MPKDGDEPAPPELMDWQKKQKEFELVKARAKELRLRLTCTICGEKAKLNCPCGTTQCAPARKGRVRRAAATRDPAGIARGCLAPAACPRRPRGLGGRGY